MFFPKAVTWLLPMILYTLTLSMLPTKLGMPCLVFFLGDNGLKRRFLHPDAKSLEIFGQLRPALIVHNVIDNQHKYFVWGFLLLCLKKVILHFPHLSQIGW